MTDLIKRLEAASAGSPELDAEIARQKPEWKRFLAKHSDDPELVMRALILDWWFQRGLASSPGWAINAVYGPGRSGTKANRKQAEALMRTLSDSGLLPAFTATLKAHALLQEKEVGQ